MNFHLSIIIIYKLLNIFTINDSICVSNITEITLKTLKKKENLAQVYKSET